MSPRLRILSGRDVVRALGTFGFEVVATRGSHAKLRRTRAAGTDTITVPLHHELAPGTARAIYRQAARFVPEDALRPWFFV
jgi:predicted RNA binding protein YcfA (HicA-like mRNA interferase family)